MVDLTYLFERLLIFLSAPFISLVNISITAGWIVLAVVLIRLLFRKAPKWLSCALWGIVALRLVFPFSVESVFSLIPSVNTINPDAIYSDSFEVNTGFQAIDGAVNTLYENAAVPAGAEVELTGILALVWVLGVCIMLSYALISWLRLKLSLRTATKKEGNIYQSESVSSPFVLGTFRPKIYLPYQIDTADEPLIIAHERAHLKRFDHLIKPLGFLLLSVYWFNPLMWVAYILLCRDIESACDEKVIRELGEECRKSYSAALLNASISRRSVAACPLAFGEVGVKERIKGVMNYKKPAFWVIIAAVVVCVVAAVCFLTNPKGSDYTDYSPKISTELEQIITVNVLNKNQGHYLDGMVSCEAHKVLAAKSGSDEEKGYEKTLTVYLVAMYQEYSVENGELVEKGGSITPLALSFLVEKDVSTGEDTYALTEYWEPGMGADYIKDLEAKFPIGVDYDTQTYVKELDAECRRQAVEYFGLNENDITEQQSVEYTTSAVEVKNNYELTVKKSRNSGVTWVTDEGFYKNNGYHVYLYCLDKADITLDGRDYYIGEALNSGKLDADKLIEKAKADSKTGKIKSDMLKDGGTVFYWYDGYTLIKRNSLGSNDNSRNKDLIIGYADMSISEYSACVDFIEDSKKGQEGTTDVLNGVTAPVGYNDQPSFDAVVLQSSEKSLRVKTISDAGGIGKDKIVDVSSSKLLSYTPNVYFSSLKKGDKIRVIYDDTNIRETYPVQVDAWAVYSYVE